MKFAELKIGEVFQFEFDRRFGLKWVYEKISNDLIKAVGTPNTESSEWGRLHEITEILLTTDCYIIPGC